jgi:hypothetical protein
MKKIVALFLIGIPIFTVFPQETGLSFTVFVPESLYSEGTGAIDLQNGFSLEPLKIGDMFSVPLQLWYVKASLIAVNEYPGLQADVLAASIGLKTGVDLGVFSISLSGGGVGAWLPYHVLIQDGLKGILDETDGYVLADGWTSTVSFLSGWYAGLSLRIPFSGFSINLSGEYRMLSGSLGLTGSWYNRTGGALSTIQDLPANAQLNLQGLAFSIGGSIPLP